MPIMNHIPEKLLKYQFHKENAKEDRRFLIQYITSTIIFEYDYRNKKLYCDSFYKDFVGFEMQEIDIENLSWIYDAVYFPHVETAKEFMDLAHVYKTCSRRITIKIMAASGSFEWFRLTLICYVGKDKEKKTLFITMTNVNQEMTALNQLEFLAKSDPLTRIPNKETFFQRTREILDENDKKQYVLIRMDVDHFATITQLYGSEQGDKILQYIAVKIQEYLEADENGSYCRLESAAFGILMDFTTENVEQFEQYMQDVLRIYPLKFEIMVSFGYYVIDEPEVDIRIMMERALTAQKLIRGNVVKHAAYYDEEMKRQENVEQKIALEMRNALATGEFHVYLQPKCDMATGKIIGSEELVRWIHPEFGMISPGDFIPVFEKNGFISELDRYILKTCCEYLQRWMKTGIEPLPISVNISRNDLYNPNLYEAILKTVDSYEIPHRLIEFELTETSFVSDNAQLTNLSNKLQEQGFRVLMDDFGSGYSSLNCLKDIYVDVLKIDLKFLPVSKEETRASAILKAVIAMAKELELDIIVEGVETKEQVDLLMELGCSNAQGFYFYRPMPVGEYEDNLLKNRERQSG